MTVVIKKELPFLDHVTQKSGQLINLCFQCQKCTSGCPIAEQADYSPNQILRLIQMGLRGQVLNSSVIWLCSGCETCGARCPNGIKLSEVFDTLKEMCIKEGINKQKKIQTFNQTFLSSVELNGRVQELTMMAEYKLKTANFADLLLDIGLGWKMFSKGKLALPTSSKKVNNLAQNIFGKTRN